MAGNCGLREIKKHEPSQFTREFSEFYSGIISKLYNVECKEFLSQVKSALKNIRRENYDIGYMTEKQYFGNVSFTESATRCAYMYAYSIINTSVVYCEFLKYIKEKERLALEIFSVSTIKICCLGGGPATEAVAVCKSINDAVWKSCQEDKSTLVHVHVTVVDICPEWESEALLIFNNLNKNTKLFNLKRVRFEFEFLQADLLKPLSEDLQKVIKESKITMLVKIVNAIQLSSRKDKTLQLENMVKSVIKCMPENSCLFLLDTAGGNTFIQVTDAIPAPQRQRNLHKAYRLHSTVLQKLENTIGFRRFADSSTLFPTPLTKISSCIWMKTAVPVKEKKRS